MAKEVTKKAEDHTPPVGNDLVTLKENQLPAGLELSTITADSGLGVSDMSADDVALPYISILQAMSPQVEPGRTEYVEGAIPSMFLNTVSLDIYEGRTKGLLFVPCAYDRRYVEWVDRDKGGGFIADYEIDSDILSYTKKDDKGKFRMPSGNIIIETAYHSGLYLDPVTSSWSEAVMALKSTGLKVNRRWNNELTTAKIPGTDLQAPRWLYVYRLTTWLETKNNKSWWQLKADRYEEEGRSVMVSPKIYDRAKKFYQLVTSGEIKRSVEKEPTAPDDQGGGRGHEDRGDPDIPF